ncbi:beta strand repeat-containing protein, partial [Arcobacter sp. YIC-464]|uniref:beta strand repeat-containing protein n=1 Tax=Arcobacter sp. YIC-464 TaxID=3376631 RepID=UPI003C2AE760
DNNSDISSVTVDFSAFGGGSAVSASNSSGTWTATYTIVSGSIDTTNVNISVKATNSAGNTTTTADTSNATVDSELATVSDANISISGASGTAGTYIVGDTVTATWNNTAGGDNNSDTVSSVTVDFSAFGGGSSVAASNSSGTWTATYTIVSGSTVASNLNIAVVATDNAGNTTTTADTTNASLNNQVPTVSSVSVPSNGTYISGDDLEFTVNVSENVTVNTSGGTPQIAITIGSTTRQATYVSGSGTTALVFRYTVQAGDLDSDGIAVGSLSANSGTLKDAAGNDLTTTLNSIGSTTSVLVDAVAPTVSSVSVPTNGTYVSGDNLEFTVNVSENVTVNTSGGTPQIAITIGSTTRQATYVSGSGTTALVFRYTVQSGDLDSDGVAVGNLIANSGTLKDSAGNDLTTTLNSIGSTTAVLVDAVVPTITITESKSTAINGEVIDLTFTLSENSSDFIVDDISVVGGSLSEFTQSTSNTKVYTAKLTIDDTTTTQATIDVNASKFTDSVGNANSAATQKAITIFPSVVKLTPVKDSTDAALNSDLKIEFSEEVVKGTTGSINIYKTSDDGLVETIDINDSKITIENPNSINGLTNTTVTIAKATQLDLVTGYYVTISNTAFKDVNDNLFEGISNKTTWAFTTIDNQAPTISNNSSNATATISVDENQTAVVDIDATDPDLGQTLTYSISGTDASSFDIDSTTGVITFKTAPDYETKSSYSITVKASDDSTVSLSDTQALTVNINDVNEAPTSANNSFTINEDTTKTFASTDFAFNDVDNANTLNSIKIVTLPSKGNLQLNSSDVVVNQSILKADISKLTYTPVANENGSSYSSFTFKVNDGNLDSTSAYTMTVNVTAVDDAPEITTTLGNQTQVEDGEGLVISLATSDIDSDASTATYAVTSSDENIATAYIRDGKLIVVPQKNANGNVTITLTSTVGGKSTTKTFTYTLTGVNDAPTISSIDDITHEQTSSVINKTITFDIWDDVEVTSLTATSSNQNLLPNSSIVIPSAPYGSQSTLTYTISENNAGKADITITAKDAQGLSYSESFKITVESQSDAQCVENAKTALIFDTIKLNNSFQNALNSNLDLVTDISSVCDAIISWETTDSNVVDTNGAVTQGSDNKTIMLTANITKGEFSTNKEFLVTVLPSTVSASEALSKLTFETIKEQNSSKATIISKLNLPTSILGEDIIWTSSDDSVISPYSGYVTRNTTEDKEVTLTATIGSESKTFALTVLKEETSDLNSVTKDTQLLTIESLLGENTDKNSIIYNLAKPLPTTGANGSTISWSSSNTAFITNEGDVLRDANANKTVVLTATITKGSETTTKEFTFQVLQNKIETASSNTFVNAGTTTNGTQVSTSANSQTTQTFSTFASTILNTVDTIVSQGSIRSIVEVAEKIVNVYLNTDGTTKSTLQSTTGSASLENKNVGSTTNVEDDGDIVSSNSDNTIRLKLNNDGTVTHEVVNNTVSKTSTATSKVANSSVRSDESGNVETTSEVKKDGYIYKAVVSTNATGETTTKFVRVDLSTGEQSNVDSTVSSSTPFQAGNEVEISEIDGNLYIKTTTPLDGNLEIE